MKNAGLMKKIIMAKNLRVNVVTIILIKMGRSGATNPTGKLS
jgi:hypothetical protein